MFDSDIRKVPNMLKGVKAKPTEAICERKVKVLWSGCAGVGLSDNERRQGHTLRRQAGERVK